MKDETQNEWNLNFSGRGFQFLGQQSQPPALLWESSVPQRLLEVYYSHTWILFFFKDKVLRIRPPPRVQILLRDVPDRTTKANRQNAQTGRLRCQHVSLLLPLSPPITSCRICSFPFVLVFAPPSAISKRTLCLDVCETWVRESKALSRSVSALSCDSLNLRMVNIYLMTTPSCL